MEEDIKLVEKFIEYSNYEGCIDFNDYIGECDIRALENLLKRYKELEEENKELTKFRDIEIMKGNTKFRETLRDSIYFDYIHISLIQNKIEKLKREFDFYGGREHFEWQDGEFDGEVCDDIALKIGVLQELLEEHKQSGGDENE